SFMRLRAIGIQRSARDGGRPPVPAKAFGQKLEGKDASFSGRMVKRSSHSVPALRKPTMGCSSAGRKRVFQSSRSRVGWEVVMRRMRRVLEMPLGIQGLQQSRLSRLRQTVLPAWGSGEKILRYGVDPK